MKKILALVLTIVLTAGLFTGCAIFKKDAEDANADALIEIKVGASITPHAEILKIANEDIQEKGYTLKIVEFEDYILPNEGVQSGELDANYFQHKSYLDNYNEENNSTIVSVAAIHYEPFGIYPGKTKSLADLKDGAEIGVPNDTTNEARALALLEAQGLITLKEGVGLNATVLDIVENPKNLKIKEVEAAILGPTLQDFDLAVINGNYAIQAGLKVATDALATEDKDSLGSTTFANIIAVKAGNENDEKTKALVEAIKSDRVKEYIETTYEGAVIPVF